MTDRILTLNQVSMRRKSGDVEADGFPTIKIIVLVPLYEYLFRIDKGILLFARYPLDFFRRRPEISAALSVSVMHLPDFIRGLTRASHAVVPGYSPKAPLDARRGVRVKPRQG
jgi:hypothetical protein